MPGYTDLNFLGTPAVIATAIVRGPHGVALIDPGPSTTIAHLEEGLAAHDLTFADVRALLLTHIHLDHCGATGSLVAAHPHLEVYVHERGAPHMVDPTKLIASAARLYGDAMERLWGEIKGVPAERVHALGERTTLEVGGRRLEAIYTPGHASHHVSYLDEEEGTAYVGDTAGMCRPGTDTVMAPSLPPDVNLEAWRESTTRLLEWRPQNLFLTHFGTRPNPAEHIARFWRRLDAWATRVRASFSEPGSDEGKAAAFAAWALQDLTDDSTPDNARAMTLAAPLELCWMGLARYWRKAGVTSY